MPIMRFKEKYRELIAASGGKVLAKYARLKMHLDKATFSRLLNTISDHVVRKVHLPDRSQTKPDLKCKDLVDFAGFDDVG